jgi:spermidine synthase
MTVMLRDLGSMVPTIEELDCCASALGELILRRRRPASMPDTWVYEVKLDGRFLMSSHVQVSEVELARRALQRLPGSGWRVLVGGLGLGCSAVAALEFANVAELDVVEYLPEVISWHRRGLVPLASRLLGDRRCRIQQGDCFRWLRECEIASYDAVLIDIDDAPDELLSPDHEPFYSVKGLRSARDALARDGVFALWTSYEEDRPLLDRLRQAFGNGTAEEVEFHNPLLERDEVNTIYFARA